MLPAASLAAFVLARYPFKGRELIYGLFTLGLLFPVAVAILPLFIVLRQIGLLSNPLGVALPQAAFGLPISIVDHAARSSAPSRSELQDAAAIDGCGPFRFYWSIMLPLSRPVLSTIAVITIVGSWNAFLLPLLVLIDPNQHTLPIGVNNISDAVLDRLRHGARLHHARRWCRRWCSTPSPNVRSSAGSPPARSRNDRSRPTPEGPHGHH